MRIVFVAGSASIGGAERSLLDIIASIVGCSSDAELILIAPGHGPLHEAARKYGVTTYVLGYPSSVANLGDAWMSGQSGLFEPAVNVGRQLTRFAFAIPQIIQYRARLRALLRELNPDVVHTHGMKPHAMVPVCVDARTAVVWHMHDLAAARPLMRRVLSVLARRIDAAVAVSRCVADSMQELPLRQRPEVILNAVDVERFSPVGTTIELEAKAGRANEFVRAGLISTAGRFKGHDVFLRAMAQLKENDAIRGYVIGGAIYKTRSSEVSQSSLETLAEELGIADRVTFLGHVADSSEAMRALDIVVHATTRPEPFGLVVVEAMACGKPVVASGAGGVLEIVSDGVDGFTFFPGDHLELAQQILRLSDDPSLREKIGRSARQTAERRFDRARLGRQVLGVLGEAIRRRRAVA